MFSIIYSVCFYLGNLLIRFLNKIFILISLYFENEFFEKCILNSYIWKNWF